MKIPGLRIMVAIGLLAYSARAGTTVIDFEEFLGVDNRTPFPANFHGVTFGPDFGVYSNAQELIPAHSGEIRALSNRFLQGWKECLFTFTTPNQRFIGAWFYVFGNSTVQFRMYNDGQLVATSGVLGDTAQMTFLASDYYGPVDMVGIWGYRGYYVIDDITFSDGTPAPRRAQASATVVNGSLTSITIVDSGFAYDRPPRVMISDPTGTGAFATATVTNGGIQTISVTASGQNYSSSPTVRIGLPSFVEDFKIKLSKIKLEMTLEIGGQYQLYSSSNSMTWNPVDQVFTADTDSKVLEVDVQPLAMYWQLRRIE